MGDGRVAASVAVLAAAGRGQRARSLTQGAPKVLLPVGGLSLLERNLRLIREALGIRDVLLVTSPEGQAVRDAATGSAQLDLRVRCVVNHDVDAGLATVLTAVAPFVDGWFVLLLADELYVGSNHADLAVPEEPVRAVCGVRRPREARDVQRNYAVLLDARGRIRQLVEKPAEVAPGSLQGCGTYLLTPAVLDDLRATGVNPRTGRLELTDVLNTAARAGAVLPFVLAGGYVNVNTTADWVEAKRLAALDDVSAPSGALVAGTRRGGS